MRVETRRRRGDRFGKRMLIPGRAVGIKGAKNKLPVRQGSKSAARLRYGLKVQDEEN